MAGVDHPAQIGILFFVQSAAVAFQGVIRPNEIGVNHLHAGLGDLLELIQPAKRHARDVMNPCGRGKHVAAKRGLFGERQVIGQTRQNNRRT